MEPELFNNGVFKIKRAYLARAFEKSVSATSGPQMGKMPLHLVLAFCKAAFSHSSRPVRADLMAFM